MTTLADINATLSNQSESLKDVKKNTEQSSKSLDSFLNYFKNKRGDDLEEERKSKSQARSAGKTTSTGTKGTSTTGMFSGLGLPGFAGLASIGGLGVLATSLMGSLAKKGIPAVIGYTLADEIGNWIGSQTGQKELGDAATQAIEWGLIGSILGRRFAGIGFILGAIMDEDVKNKLGEVGTTFREQLAKWDINLPTMDDITQGIVDGLEGIRAAITFDFDSEAFKNNWAEALALVGGIAFMFSPRGTAGLAMGAIGGLGKAIVRLGGLLTAAGFVADKADKAAAAAGAATQGATTASAKALQDQVKAATPDSKGMVRSKSGKLYKADSPQGKNIIKAGEAAKAKLNVDTGAAKKFPRFALFRKIPLVGQLISAGLIGSVLMSDASAEEKVSEIAGILGGLGGATLGAIMGGAVGLATGPGAILTGLLGGVAGAYFGDVLAKAGAQWMMGMPVDAFPDWTGLNSAFNGKSESPSGVRVDFVPNDSVPTAATNPYASKPSVTSSERRTDYLREQGALANHPMSGTPSMNAINSGNTNISSSSSSPVIMGNGSVIDQNDPFMGMLPTSP